MLDILSALFFVFLVSFAIFILLYIGFAKLFKIQFKLPTLDHYNRDRFEFKDKLKSKVRSVKVFLLNGKESQLIKIHKKLKKSDNSNNAELTVFESDTQHILNMNDDSDDDVSGCDAILTNSNSCSSVPHSSSSFSEKSVKKSPNSIKETSETRLNSVKSEESIGKIKKKIKHKKGSDKISVNDSNLNVGLNASNKNDRDN